MLWPAELVVGVKLAVIVYGEPEDVRVAVHIAFPLVTATAEQSVAAVEDPLGFSVKVTDPSGLRRSLEVTVAVRVNAWPEIGFEGLACTVVVVGIGIPIVTPPLPPQVSVLAMIEEAEVAPLPAVLTDASGA